MSEVWKRPYFVALCWTLVLNAGSYEIIQCPSTYLDTSLCSFDKVANITRMYVGGRSDDSKECIRTSGDCFLEINSTSRSWTYNEIINNCNGTSACRKPLYVYKGQWYGCYDQEISIKYQVIEYDCIHPNTGSGIKYTTQCNQQYASHPRCPVGKRIVIDEVYGGVNRASVSSSERCRTSAKDCVLLVQSKDKEDIKGKCEGRIACDLLYMNYGHINCGYPTTYWALMDYVIIQYHCVEYGAGELYYVTCGSNLQNVENTTISCPGNGINIKINDIWLGFGDHNSCNEFDLMTTKCLRTPSDGLWEVKRKCDGNKFCEIDFMKHTFCNGEAFTVNDYMLTLYECQSKLHQDRFCNNQPISTKCSDDNLIYINNVLYGYLYYDNQCVKQLRQLSSYSLCEQDAVVYDDVYYNDILSSCDGKTQCDEGLLAQQGPPTATCAGFSSETSDYIVIEYYCYPGHLGQSTEVMTTTKPATEITDVVQPTTGMLVTGDDRVINSNEASNGQKIENVKRITFIVIPIVVVIGLVIAITTAILLNKKRKQRKGTDGLGDGQSQVNANSLTRTAVHIVTRKAPSKPQSGEMNETSPYTYINNQEDDQFADGNRVPVYENNDFVSGFKSNEDNKASNVTETYSVVDKMKKIKSKTKPKPVVEANLTEVYAVVDKTKKIKSKADVEEVSTGLNVLETYADIDMEKISEAKPEADCEPNLYANVDNRGCDDSGVQPNAEGKHKRHSSVEDTVIVDNLLYGKKESL